MATEATDYVLNGNGRHESGDTSPRVTETPTETPIVENGNVKSGKLFAVYQTHVLGRSAALAALRHASAKWRAACVSGLTQK